jgi:hypothetical protein
VFSGGAEFAWANFLFSSTHPEERRVFLDVEVSNDVPEFG